MALLFSGVPAGTYADDADDYMLQVRDQPVGPYRVSVLTGPTPLSVGAAVVAVAVTTGSGQGVPDAIVDVAATLLGSPGEPVHYSARHDNAQNEQLYAADVLFPTPGQWAVMVQVLGPGGGGYVEFAVDARPLQPYRYIDGFRPPEGVSARVRLTSSGSTPTLLITPEQQARLSVPAGAFAGEPDARIELFLVPEAPPTRGDTLFLGNAYAVQAVSLADGKPAPEPWSYSAELSLRFPEGSMPDGLFLLDGGDVQLVQGSVVGSWAVQARIDRGGRYALGTRLGGGATKFLREGLFPNFAPNDP